MRYCLNKTRHGVSHRLTRLRAVVLDETDGRHRNENGKGVYPSIPPLRCVAICLQNEGNSMILLSIFVNVAITFAVAATANKHWCVLCFLLFPFQKTRILLAVRLN